MALIRIVDNIADRGLALLREDHVVDIDVPDPEAIILRSSELDTYEYPNLVAVARAGAGTNNISVEKATARGVCVFNTPGANANAVSELVFIMLGLFARRIDLALAFVQTLSGSDGEINVHIEQAKKSFAGFELAGKTLGVIGLGKIGLKVANAGIGKGMQVLGYDAFPTGANMHKLDARVDLVRSVEEVLSQADVISVHVPLSPQTRGLIGENELRLTKKGVILMNYSRAPLYDDAAVVRAIHGNHVAGYLTDFPNRALLGRRNVVCTPHLGASTAESEENCAVMAAVQLRNYLKYGVVANSVNFPVLEAFPGPGVRHRLCLVNEDVPGRIAEVTGAIGKADINIKAMVNAGNGTIGYNLIDFGDSDFDQLSDLVENVRNISGVIRVRLCSF